MSYNSAEISGIQRYFAELNASMAGRNDYVSRRMRNVEKMAEEYIAVLSEEEKRSQNKKELRNTLATISQTREMLEDMRISQRTQRRY